MGNVDAHGCRKGTVMAGSVSWDFSKGRRFEERGFERAGQMTDTGDVSGREQSSNTFALLFILHHAHS